VAKCKQSIQVPIKQQWLLGKYKHCIHLSVLFAVFLLLIYVVCNNIISISGYHSNIVKLYCQRILLFMTFYQMQNKVSCLNIVQTLPGI